MNFFLRLRFTWAVLCLFTAAFMLLSLYGGGGPRAGFALIAAVAAALCLYAPLGWFGRASLLWFSVGGGVLAVGMTDSHAGAVAPVILGGTWVVATVAVFLIRGRL